MADAFPNCNAEYDAGYFDKDEQGWVADWTSVRCNTQTGAVTVRQWGDRNGLDPYDRTFDTRITDVFPELGLVKFEAQPWYFDLKTQRLVSGSVGVTLCTGTATAGFREPARVTALLEFLAKLLSLISGASVAPPPFSAWPARPETMGQWELTRFDVPVTATVSATFQMRPAGNGPSEYLAVSLRGRLHHAALSVDGTRFTLTIGGTPELHARAKALADAWTWG